MKKALLLVVLLFVSSAVCGSPLEEYAYRFWGNDSSVSRPTSYSSSASTYQPTPSYSSAPASYSAPTSANPNLPTDKRIVAVEFRYNRYYSGYGNYRDFDSYYGGYSGNGRSYSRTNEWFEPLFKAEALKQNLTIAAWGESLDRTNRVNDYVSQSGRYQSQTIPVQGQYLAPSQLFIVTIRTWETNFAVIIGDIGGGTTTAHVELTLEINDLQTGTTKQLMVVERSSTGLQAFIALKAGIAFSLPDVERSVMGKAARHAISAALAKIAESA